MTAPFLEVITRHMIGRPNLLKQNQHSLENLKSDDWCQTLLIDEIGRGTQWANHRLSQVKPHGKWVWVLDDDDICIDPDLIDKLKLAIEDRLPEAQMIIARADISTHVGRVIPSYSFGQYPVYTDIGMPCFFVEKNTYLKNARFWPYGLAADYHFASNVFKNIGGNERTIWINDVIARSTQNGGGKPEL